MEIQNKNYQFWNAIDILVKSHNIIIDRPKGSSHPEYKDTVYPLDYGYLEGTSRESIFL